MFQRGKEGRKNVDHEAIGLSQDVANFLVYQRIEYDRPRAVAFRRFIDLLYHCPRFFSRIDIWPGELGERDGFELCQQALAECFGCNPGTVGYEKCSSFHCAWDLKSRTVLSYSRPLRRASIGWHCYLFCRARPPCLGWARTEFPTQRGEITLVEYVVSLDKLGNHDVERVGGKNASLGEMISNLAGAGVSVPGGFATTAQAYRDFMELSGLNEQIHALLDALDVDDVNALAKAGAQIRGWVMEAQFPPKLDADIRAAFAEMAGGNDHMAVAVRSSATAEDLPDASFAGQQETFLNIRGVDNVIRAAKEVFASLFNDRAIAYRVHQGFDHKLVALSAGVQRMVRSETGTAGVMFTLDTESGFRDVVFITGAYGLGETVVQGAVNPDEFYVHKHTLEAGRPAILRRNLGSKAIKMMYGEEASAGKSVKTVEVDQAERMRFCLTDEEVTNLAHQAMTIEKHYGRPMDIEWAKDGDDNQLYIVQARPETVKSRSSGNVMERYLLKEKGKVLVEGRAIGQRIGAGPVKIIHDVSEMDKVQPGDVLVSDMTDPDWEPVMKRASAIVTNRGGRTCHAAIIARELGIPAVVGCGNATELLQDGQRVTVTCAEGDTGLIFEGELGFDIRQNSIDAMPELPFKIMMNVGNPDRAFDFAQLPNEGVGLARLEFIINRMIGVHPKALLNFDGLPADVKEQRRKAHCRLRRPGRFLRREAG
jgi:pyruvate, water dikinase